jgi:hypothetical protein
MSKDERGLAQATVLGGRIGHILISASGARTGRRPSPCGKVPEWPTATSIRKYAVGLMEDGMAATGIDTSQQTAAKVAAFAYLLSFPLVVFAQFGIHDRLFVAGNAPESARNIMAHETLFRVSIACDLAYCAGFVILITALFVILKPVNQGLALLAAFWRLLYVLMWALMTLHLFDTLRLLTGADFLRVFSTEQLQALARLHLSERFDQYYIGLLFGGLASTICSYLWLCSNYIPKPLAISGVLSSAFCAMSTFVFIIFPDYAKVVNLAWFDTPMGIFEITLSFWLLFKGLRPAADIGETVPA